MAEVPHLGDPADHPVPVLVPLPVPVFVSVFVLVLVLVAVRRGEEPDLFRPDEQARLALGRPGPDGEFTKVAGGGEPGDDGGHEHGGADEGRDGRVAG